jgi:hypothetical protein
VDKVFTAPSCTNCGASWLEYRAWRTELRKVGHKPGEGNEVTPDYITSGEMKSEIESVIETAMLEARFMLMKEVGGKAAKIVTSGLEEGKRHEDMIDDLLQLLVDELKSTMGAVGKGDE